MAENDGISPFAIFVNIVAIVFYYKEMSRILNLMTPEGTLEMCIRDRKVTCRPWRT